MAVRRVKSAILAALLFCAVVITSLAALAETRAAGSTTVRVKISNSTSSFNITLKGKYTVDQDPSAVLTGTYGISLSSGKVRIKGNGYDKSFSNFTLQRQGYTGADSHSVTVEKVKVGSSGTSKFSYLGDMTFVVVDDGVRVINRVELEEYVYGVIGYEMSNSFPLEALKAQAVCARGYAVKSISSGTSISTYDLNDTSSNQVYRGYVSAWTNVKKAVDQTAGMVLKYNGSICTTYYAASNGGQTELAANAWGGSNIPYLVQKDDPYDLENPSSKEQILFVPKDCSKEHSASSDIKSEYVVKIMNVNTSCNVRSGPGTNYDNIGQAPLGSYYEWLETTSDGKWQKVIYNGAAAYISSDYAVKMKNTGRYRYENLVLVDLQSLAFAALTKGGAKIADASDVKLISVNSFVNGDRRWPSTATSRSFVNAKANLTVQYVPDGGSDLSSQTKVDVVVTLMQKSGSGYTLTHPYLDSDLRLRGVEAVSGGYNVVSRRWGHGVGMSQRGAQTMAKNHGMTYDQILKFYFVGTTIESIYGGGTDPTPGAPAISSAKHKISGSQITGLSAGLSVDSLLKNFTVKNGSIKLFTAGGAAKTSGNAGTGDLLYLYNSSGGVHAKYTLVLYGDVNGDGGITLVDLLRIQKHLLGTSVQKGAYATAADVSRDGGISLLDLLRVQKHLLGTQSIAQ